MAKLKSLRGAVGTYGRVTAGGIVDVDETMAEKLVKTGRFVRASEADIEAAQAAQQATLATAIPGLGAGFVPLPGGAAGGADPERIAMAELEAKAQAEAEAKGKAAAAKSEKAAK
ncbi:hypothetical protein SAMN05444389_101434 [Paracoccus solventivorans]|uniref:Uncharacterized protein n=1 Tax=Paracoccus solventivorans TaxID=53463 RepID=A0A1M7DLS8_9RHOB|nr:hypothetical protein [Paracoccus solventivorans]SHL80432.1 hypothetical protein SAMN05444389_101434 [Paracoccus solventivorans]